jgi:hypothetical protein
MLEREEKLEREWDGNMRYERREKRFTFFLTPKNKKNVVSGLFIVLTEW